MRNPLTACRLARVVLVFPALSRVSVASEPGNPQEAKT
jgi:hypothetical protein